MISSKDKNKIIEIAKKYGVSKLFLFGSSIKSDIKSNDIDLGVEGIDDSLFFQFYSELIFALSKPIDLIDLKKKSLLSSMIKSEGAVLYG